MREAAPGSFRPMRDRHGPFAELLSTLAGPALALVDARVARLHPGVSEALGRARMLTVRVEGGERAKSLEQLGRVAEAARRLPRGGTLLAIGGGSVGDLGTMSAHLLKRGLRLIQVPTTLLAAVDSSLGGKGALDVRVPTGQVAKNLLGAFHYPEESWLCGELLATLSEAQRREGRVEALKTFACFSATRWRRHEQGVASIEELVRDARAVKARVCARDPYDTLGPRAALNFGHTFGHVLESATRFSLSHGAAVALGIACALDVGRAMRVTPPKLARRIEAAILPGGREELAEVFRGVSEEAVAGLLAADKKVSTSGALRMVLLPKLGEAALAEVPRSLWRELLGRWRASR